MDTRHHLILYDGVCGLCTRLIQFVLPRDREAHFVFASLQSPAGRNSLSRFGKNPDDLNTVVVIVDFETAYAHMLTKAPAALFILQTLGGRWSLFAVLRLLPVRLLDRGYDLIARHRYRFFGRRETCWLPTPANRSRFLDM